MALHQSVRVPVPSSKTYKRKQYNSTYVYYYTSFFRNSKGKPSNTSVNIGKYDEERDMMIPNDHYYEYFDSSGEVVCPMNIEIESEYSLGYSLVVKTIASALGLENILEDTFNSMASKILTLAGYTVRKGAVMSYIDNYMEHNCDIFRAGYISNQRASEIFESITSVQKRQFFTEWIKKCEADQCFVYDVTSVSTYSNSLVQAEFGYNRDKEPLRQINIGLFSGEHTKLPVYYENYNGSLTDKKNMLPVLKHAEQVGIKNAHIVMDGVFFDKVRLNTLNDAGFIFTVGMPIGLKESRELLNLHRNEIHSISNRTSYTSNYADLFDANICGIDGRVLIGLDTQMQDLMMETLKKDIEKREEELKNKAIKKYSTVVTKKEYTDLFDITEDGKEGYTYKLKEEQIQKHADNYGYYLVFTTNMNTSAEDILYYYKEKDTDEKMFYQLKDNMGFYRLRTHDEKTTSGKIFTLFIGLIIRSYMQKTLKEYMIINNMTFERCMEKMEDIKALQIHGQPPMLLKEITKKQREILELFGIDINSVPDNV